MRTKIICLTLVLIVVLTIAAVPCFGLNFSKDVIEISSVSDLKALSQAVSQDYEFTLRDKKFVLLNDIEGFGGSIGNSGFPFMSEFDGCGHTIELKDSDGLFYYICDGTVKNLTVSGTVSGTGTIGAIAASVASGTRIINCSNYAKVTSNYPIAGGIIGKGVCVNGSFENRMLNGERLPIVIENCANYGEITAPSFAGAICGKAADGKEGYTDQSAYSLILNNCYFGGTVNGEVKDYQSYEQLNEAVAEASEYLPWIDQNNDGIPELDYSSLPEYTGSFISDGSIAVIAAVVIAAGIAIFAVEKKKVVKE